MIAIVDYGMGNVRSVRNALDAQAVDAEITADPNQIDGASHLILPGVGAFGDAMENLRARGLVELLQRQVLEKGKPLLGICLGLQLLARTSCEHGLHEGLGWLDAEIVRFCVSRDQLKVPHMGWNDVELLGSHPVFAGLRPSERTFYFVHSFHMVCDDPAQVVAWCQYGYAFAASVARDNIVGTQFHPEKSQDNGLHVLKNFASWRPS